MDNINRSEFFAHSENEAGKWHTLSDHLKCTADIAQSFARTPLEKVLFRYAALLHDAGKYQPQFQSYLKNGGRRGSVPHAAHGAALAYKRAKQNAVSIAVLGHHQGMLDFGKVQGILRDTLDFLELSAVESELLRENPEIEEIESRSETNHCYQRKDNQGEFFTRYLFSALTDADWLDTEEHFSPDKSVLRKRNVLKIDELLNRLECHFRSFSSEGSVNLLRNAVRDEVASQSDGKVGSYSLNVPTGLGKTLTSVFWALKHAKKNNLKRIIVVLPFVNIIDQTAAILSKIFGDEVVLEHHSGILEDEASTQSDEQTHYNPKKLATENWDYPLIVTTTVQFFESLFSNKPSKCRKIHNIADSVVIFDEVQSLRQELVLPSIEMLKQVQDTMNVSFLFCTATLPAFESREKFDGLNEICPLIRNPAKLFAQTRRVEYAVVNQFQPLLLSDLIAHVNNSAGSVLAVFNTKKDAKNFFLAVKNLPQFDRVFHLSTNMCPVHRRATIAEIKRHLDEDEIICVASTQLIEAGVDLDFPTVYRALAPLESIIQAAGRCNREGRLGTLGKVYLFLLADSGMPDALYRTCADYTKSLILNDLEFLERHDSFTDYYRQIHSLFIDGDKRRINESRRNFLFETVAECYQLIDSNSVPVFIRSFNEESETHFNRLKNRQFLTRTDIRNMQPFLVNFYRKALFDSAANIDRNVIPGVFVWEGKYSSEFGVISDTFSPEELVL